jgi:hypothetical protein
MKTRDQKNIMKRSLALILICFITGTAVAQQVVMSQDVESDTTKKEKSGSKTVSDIFIGYGLIIGEQHEGAKTVTGGTNNFRTGIRTVRKFGKTIGLGYELLYSKRSYRLIQDDKKILPYPFKHDKEKIIFNDLDASLFMRFTYSGKEKSIGNFIDIGGGGGWVFKSTHLSQDKIPGNSPAKKFMFKETGLSYTEDFQYFALVRLGFGRYVVYGEYRLSDVFPEGSVYPELPRITAGLQIGLH